MWLREIRTLEAANVFLAEEYIAEYYRRFAVAAAEKGGAFLRCPRKDLDWGSVSCTSARERRSHRGALKLRDGTVAIRYGPHEVARFAATELPPAQPKRRQSPRPLGHGRVAA